VTGSPDQGTSAAAAQSGAAAHPSSGSGRQSAHIVATGILLSRIAGLIRDRIIAQFLGTSLFASAFRAGLRMPNVLQNLLGEGTLSASFIPVYSELLERGETEAAGRLAGTVFAMLLAVASGFALLGATAAPVLVSFFFPGFSGELRALTIRCVRILFPMTGILVLSAWALGILNSHRRFFISYTAPVAWSAAIIVTLFVFGGRLTGADLVIAACWGALVGGALQFLVQLPWVLRLERFGGWPAPGSSAAKRVVRNAGPAILGRGVVQISTYVDLLLASTLFEGAVATLGYAQTLYVLPVSLFGMAIAAAELPEMSRQGRAASDALRARLESGLRQIAVLVVPSAVGYIVMGDVIVGALYQSGAFHRLDTLLVWIVLGAYSFGLIASTSTRLYSSAFYALQNTKTPAQYAAIRVVAAAALGGTLMLIGERYALVSPLRIIANPGDLTTARPLGAAGLALGAGLSAWIEWMLLRRSMRRHLGGLASGARVMVRLLVSAAIPALALRLLVLPRLLTLHPIPLAAVVLPVYGIAYFAIAMAVGVKDVRHILVRTLGRATGRGP